MSYDYNIQFKLSWSYHNKYRKLEEKPEAIFSGIEQKPTKDSEP
jgi:hypothetical protein